MSSQGNGISLYNTPDNTGYRLLELPPDLEKQLDSDSPPPYGPPYLFPHAPL